MNISNAYVTPEAFSPRVGRADAPTIIDVRRRQAFETSGRLIAGARWRDHAEALAWANELGPDSEIVIYCVHGHQVSQSAAALLRSMGIDARVLSGGIEAYTACGGTTLAMRPEVHDAGRPSRWVTCEGQGVDQLACVWLIRRFVDASAHILFVGADQVTQVAQETGGVAFGHHGEHRSFDAFLRRFAIDDCVLNHMARMVLGADTARLDLAPECAGLRAMSIGACSAGEPDAISQAMTLYDALYAWARHARGEHLQPTVA